MSVIRDLIRRISGGTARLTYISACAALLGSVSAPAPIAAAQDWPVIPDPVAVDLDASTTAYLVLDMVDAICGVRPSCLDTVPAAATILSKARAADALVVWTTGRAGGTIVPGLESRDSDPMVGGPADKFFNSNLDEILSSNGVRTVVLAGVAANGAPMYTSFGASMRGYNVVVAQDAISAPDDFAVFLARWQLLNEPGFDNPSNGMVEGRPNLSTSDLITFHR